MDKSRMTPDEYRNFLAFLSDENFRLLHIASLSKPFEDLCDLSFLEHEYNRRFTADPETDESEYFEFMLINSGIDPDDFRSWEERQP